MEGENNMILSFWQDKRLTRICHMLTGAGYRVGIAGCTLPSGMPIEVMLYPDWRSMLGEAYAILLPLPAFRGSMIAFGEEAIAFSDFLSCLRPGTVLLGGMVPLEKIREAEAAGMYVYDYYSSEAVIQRNGELTAEGAISIAMQELPVALDEARVGVVGCGRIGNALCRMLKSMNSNVTALARREEALSSAKACGCRTALLGTDTLIGMMKGYDAVFTTVPARIFSEEILKHSERLSDRRKTLFIDLSSSPGSFDPIAARTHDLHLLWALSLPGKYAPDSAGAVLGKEILRLLYTHQSMKGE